MSGLNASQQRYVMAVFAEVSRHLDSIEALVEGKPAALMQPVADLSQTECERLRSFLAGMRQALLKTFAALHLPRPDAGVSAKWSVHTHLEFADVEFQELTASKLRGYGALDEHAYVELLQAVKTLRADLQKMLDER